MVIDIGFETVKTTTSSDTTFINEAIGFEGAIGSSKDDTIISGGGINNLVGGAGQDVIIGNNNDFVDYSLEEAFSHQSPAFHIKKGIIADLKNGGIIDTYGYKDTLQRNDDDLGIKNVIGTSKDDIIIGSDDGSQIYAGQGNDEITITGKNNTVISGLGDDVVNINAETATIYGDAHGLQRNDTFILKNEFENITIEDFETNSDNLLITLKMKSIEVLEGLNTSTVKLKKMEQVMVFLI